MGGNKCQFTKFYTINFMKTTLLFFLLLLLLSSCNRGGIVLSRYPNGSIKTELKIVYVKGNSVCIVKEYSEDGIIISEINYKTLDAKVYHADGKGYWKGRYNKKLIMNGVWEDWLTEENYKRFDWTFKNNIEDGPYTAYRRDGSIEAKGFYKNGALSDTLKMFDLKGQLQEMEIWVVNAGGKFSTCVKTIYLTDKRSDGTIQILDGKIYVWKNGKKEFMRNFNGKK